MTMLIAWIAVLVALAGVLTYALSSNAKVVEIGRIAYFIGLFWTVASLARVVVHLP